MHEHQPVFESPFLQAAERIAVEAHGTQQRQFEDAPYWRHLQRVAGIVWEQSRNEWMTAAALFHDVLEDTSWTATELERRIAAISSAEQAAIIIQWVKELTDQFVKGNYPDWNRARRKQAEAERLAQTSGAAQTIKYADVMDNSRSLNGDGASFAYKYLREALHLLQSMEKGDAVLREQALQIVRDEMTRKNITIPSR
ncbi:HD domain-containing protein [Nostoc ellipsosporum NOK]|nr:HD domain-containing protein [Nostoc ellipsosporum NOK]